jgi:hypothetical protein
MTHCPALALATATPASARVKMAKSAPSGTDAMLLAGARDLLGAIDEKVRR